MADIFTKHAVLILGNGFDVALGYNTKYSDFYKSETFGRYATETKLGKHIKENITGPNWTDLECGLYDFAKNDELFVYNGTDEERLIAFRDDFKKLKEALYRFLLQEQSREPSTTSKIPALLSEWFRFNLQVFTFNYTSIDFNIIKEYSPSEQKRIENSNSFIYQHGSLTDINTGSENSPSNIVLGIDESQTTHRSYSFLCKNLQPRLNVRNLLDNVRDKDVIIIYGCSIGPSDTFYFKQIFSSFQNKRYIIYHYGESELETIKSKILSLTGSLDEFECNNHVEFIDSSSPDVVEKTKNIIDSIEAPI